MYVKIKVKQLVIVLIVLVVTLGSIFYDMSQQIYNPTLEIGYAIPNVNVDTENFSTEIWDDLKEIQSEYTPQVNSEYEGISLEYIQTNSVSKLEEITSKNDVIVISGTYEWEDIVSLFIENPSKQFVLINNQYDNSFDNVTSIIVDMEELITNVANSIANQTKTKQIGIVGKEEEMNKYYEMFEQEIKAIDSKIKIEKIIIDDADNSSQITEEMQKGYESGIDYMFIMDPELNDAAIQLTKSYQAEIDENEEKKQLLKLADENIEAETTNENTETDATNENTETDATNENTETDATDESTDATNENSETDATDENTKTDATDESTDATDENTKSIDVSSSDNQNNDINQDIKEFPQEKVGLILFGSQDRIDGIYEDSNENGILDEKDATVLYDAIDINYKPTIEIIIQDIVESETTKSSYKLTFENGGMSFYSFK